jgi:molecular chaperone DnaK (HSP70)
MRTKTIAALLLGLLYAAGPVFALPTHITIRVKTKGAKFLGTSMGGALVTIRDAETGELLAKGITSGSTGNTERIMKAPRGVPVSDEGSAKFTATIDIDGPRLLEVTAYGPLSQRQAANRVSATQWVVPGEHITGGDGWLMELPGLAVQILSPRSHVLFEGVPQTVKIEANITMM